MLVIDKSIYGGTPQEVYELAGGSWNLRGTLTAPPSGRSIRTAFDTSRGVIVMFSGAQVALGFSAAMVGPFALPLDLSFYGLTGCSPYHDLALILFGTTV
ncbi:MAG: hypothetical protein KDE27_03620 [Planctomycetes bacterium]|nr:hypothetical protein [Planctomycetota bacterium]